MPPPMEHDEPEKPEPEPEEIDTYIERGKQYAHEGKKYSDFEQELAQEFAPGSEEFELAIEKITQGFDQATEGIEQEHTDMVYSRCIYCEATPETFDCIECKILDESLHPVCLHCGMKDWMKSNEGWTIKFIEVCAGKDIAWAPHALDIINEIKSEKQE